MAGNNGWEKLLDPGKATDFFAGHNGMPALDPARSTWDRGQAWWCSEISRTIYLREGREAYLEPVDLHEVRFFDAGSTQAALVAGSGFAVLVFRGSADLRDWWTNLRMATVEWPRGGRVHRGFARALGHVWHDVAEELDRLTLPTFVTGHSLGGALATLAASQREFVAAYTFGAPRIGDAAFWQTLRCPLYRVVNERDAIPTLIPRRLGYADGGLLQLLGEHGRAHDDLAPQQPVATASSPDRRRWFEPHETLANHDPLSYSAHLAE